MFKKLCCCDVIKKKNLINLRYIILSSIYDSTANNSVYASVICYHCKQIYRNKSIIDNFLT